MFQLDNSTLSTPIKKHLLLTPYTETINTLFIYTHNTSTVICNLIRNMLYINYFVDEDV